MLNKIVEKSCGFTETFDFKMQNCADASKAANVVNCTQTTYGNCVLNNIIAANLCKIKNRLLFRLFKPKINATCLKAVCKTISIAKRVSWSKIRNIWPLKYIPKINYTRTNVSTTLKYLFKNITKIWPFRTIKHAWPFKGYTTFSLTLSNSKLNISNFWLLHSKILSGFRPFKNNINFGSNLYNFKLNNFFKNIKKSLAV